MMILVISFIVVLGLMVVVYSWPEATQSKKKKKKRKRVAESQEKEETKDWQPIAERFERQSKSLAKDVEKKTAELERSEAYFIFLNTTLLFLTPTLFLSQFLSQCL